MGNASRQIVNKAWNFVHVPAQQIIDDPGNTLEQLRGITAELKA